MVKDNRKLKFNIIDLIIILFMILAIIGIIIRYDLADDINFGATGEEFDIEFMVMNIQRGTEDYLQAGEKFYITIESIFIGEVTDIIDVRGAVEYVETTDGNIVGSTIPERVDVTGVMRSRGRTTKEGVMLNGNIFVTANTRHFIHTGKRECWIVIMDVQPVN
jgi:hypothetical protein